MTDRDKFLFSAYGDSNSDLTTIDDPTSRSFKIFFYFAENTGLLGDEDQVNTAANYLKRNKMTKQLNYINKFKDLLSRISSETPYIFLNIGGIDTGIMVDFAAVASEEKQLIITCRETRLNPIQALIQLYRFACFDTHLKKEIVPVNLRKFSMGVYLTEFNHAIPENSSNFARKFIGADTDNLFLKNHQFFEFGQCEFNLSQGIEYYADISNQDPDYEKTIDLIIDFKTMSESGVYRGLFGEEKIQGNTLIEDLAQITLNDATAPNVSNADATKRTYSVQPINPKLLTPIETEIPENRVANAKKLPPNVERISPFRKSLNRFEQAIRQQAQNSIRGALSQNIAPLTLGNVNGLSIGQLKQDINQIKDGNISTLFSNIRNFSNFSNGDYTKSLGNAVKRIENRISATKDAPSLLNFTKKVIRGL